MTLVKNALVIAAGALMLLAGGEPVWTSPTAQAQAPADAAKRAARAPKKAKRPVAKKTEKVAPATDAAAIDGILDAAEKSIQAGRADTAVGALNGVLTKGGVPGRQMARGLYLRGLAYRRQSKPAQAIADLTSALWLKGGLTEIERAAAIKARSDASREAGLPEPGAPPQEVAAIPAVPTPQPTPARVTIPEAAPKPIASTRVATASAPTRPAPTRIAAPGTAGPPATSSWSSGTEVTPRPERAAPQPPAPESGGFSSFLNGLLGSPQPSPPPPQPTPPAVAAKPWDSATQAVPSSKPAPAPSRAVRTASLPSPAAASTAKPVTGGFRAQIALMRSREEAAKVAARVKAQHGEALASREPVIDETVLGSMGKFYRVRIGPYASATEPSALCNRLRPKGFECMVVTQ